MRRSMVFLAVLALVMAACASTDTTDTTTSPVQSTTTTAAVPTTTEAPAATSSQTEAGGMLTVADAPLGTVLVDGAGNTLYLFTPDEQGPSVCYDQCEAAWPPLTASVAAGDGVDAALLGSAPRTDGTDQVTYNGWPLYYFASDTAPGDLNGQGLNGVWYVLDAAGDPIGLDG